MREVRCEMRESNGETPPQKVRGHHDLKVWHLGMEVAERCHRLAKTFPREETYGLVSQLQRAAVSVPANIAEGNGRDSVKDYLRHLSIAVGSLCEVETLIRLACRFEYVEDERVESLLDSIEEESRMLRGLQKSLRASIAK